jgi:hypothetical protein
VARALTILLLTALWPAIHLLVFLVRFDRLPPGRVTGAWVFAPMGLAAALFGLSFWKQSSSRRQRRLIAIGYVLAMPLGFIGSLIGGLFLPGAFGPLAFGFMPLALGCAMGFLLGRAPVPPPPPRRSGVESGSSAAP